ncbi:MAG TPA: hypothetical protein VM368_03925 [Flavisolibacter sp.]|nr:hypothetical protein [Flavisolibacter sp.]
MTQTTKFYAIRSFLFLLFITVFQLAVLAQETSGENTGGEEKSTTTTSSSTKISVTSDGGGGDWYTSPWVWVIGAAVFILLLVALLSNKGGDRTVSSTSDRVTVKKSVEKDSDTAL